MSTSYFFAEDPTKTHYIKSLPLTESPWATGIVAASRNGTTYQFSATTDDDTEYAVYEQQAGSSASTDILIGLIPSLQEAILEQSISDDLHLCANAIAGVNEVTSLGSNNNMIVIKDPEGNTLRTIQFNPVTGNKDIYTS